MFSGTARCGILLGNPERVPRTYQGLNQFAELRLRKCMPLLEQVGVGVVAKEFNNVPQFFICG